MEECGEHPSMCSASVNTPGYDHITSAIGAAIAVGKHSDALLRDAEGAPRSTNAEDVPEGLITKHKIATYAADIARHRRGARDRDDELSRARYNFDWNKQFELSLDPERAKEYHDETLPADIYKQAEFYSMCRPTLPMQTRSPMRTL